MNIERVYVAHTNYCATWDIDTLLKGTVFRKAITTHRNKLRKNENPPKMLDWDFKDPDPVTHLKLAKKYDLELVMAPDVLEKVLMSQKR